MTEPLDIRLLGPFEVLSDGVLANVSGSKRQMLLALLGLRGGRAVAVDSVIDALWGDELPTAPRNAVQHHVARLRATLGAEAIVSAGDGYALRPASVDAQQFEELLDEARGALREADARAAAGAAGAALRLWRGPALLGLIETPWFRAEAQRLEALRVDALEERFEAALALGEHRGIISELQAALDENPFRERLWGQLMLALYRSGRQADALETFQEARRLLSDELALEPGPELRKLQEAILVQDPAIAPVEVVPERRGNLPAPATSFVGRERELSELVRIVHENRLVTLTGPPGVGKSRLALEAARSVEPSIRDGAWLIELSRAGGESDLARLLAEALDLRGADLLARVNARLRDSDALLVFDACEHMTAEVGRAVSAILTEAPHVKVIATTREVLHVDGETRVAVDPLGLPEPDSETGSPAVDLFVARARAARPGFVLTADALPVVAEISRLVDGLPLAIELAAARVSALGLAELLSLVERRRVVLRPATSTDAERTAFNTLVEWSYELLHADEKTLLQQIAVHRGSASLQSLVELGAAHGLDEATVAYLLGALTDKSVVAVSFPDGAARYAVLDTVRAYALDKLAAAGTLAEARRAHAEYFAALADDAHGGLRGPEWRTWMKRLQAENDNLWAAVEYARDARDGALAARLGAGLAWYFALGARISEGRRFLEVARDTADDEAPLAARVELIAFSSYLATEEDDTAAAIELGERALALCAGREAEVGSLLGVTQAILGLAYVLAGDGARGAALAAETDASLTAAASEWELAGVSVLRAQIAARSGDDATAAEMAAATRAHAAASGFDAFEVPAAVLEAWLAEQRVDRRAAIDHYHRTIELANRTGLADHAAFALARLGACAVAEGDPTEAESLFRRALAAAEAAHAPMVAAHARVELGRILASGGDTDTAGRLYRNVVAWGRTARPHEPRESLFVALLDDPAAAAQAALAELGEPALTP